ncbi:undecaprenyldiphospho-muramoylpentapeptide beta-N-acetylglucosaminyltransferase [Kocuria sp.]|uniref:undecaprenyldiphospho-muramoylpentapeptide beta-N-acetylglucosaminyltransferase n=1 Tax=Kocuria sp. TaxID=1871328 RepID=UPI0026E012FF|nr:undecaprenyldiphospho-muramoylpentapeptide beta-N-acetylglucosaminyltransferase [Kocuria sp.]MDO5618451.1 undecaprenyldiphospho-muramoylpentapeptide beta-N-acetylglucosaminyltransferase [Kocuria sp.]
MNHQVPGAGQQEPTPSSAAQSTAGVVSVVIAGGGTAGHVSPLLAIARALQDADPSADITAVGTTTGMETRLVPAAGLPLETIDRVPLPRKPSMDLLKLPLRLRGAVKQAGQIIDRHAADVVVGVGGYVSTPMYLAAKRRGIPVVIHEANARPGLANRVGARFAAVVATAFPDTPIAGARTVGMPMRPEIAGLDRAARQAEARQALGLDPALPTVILTGGSSGAQSMNQTMSQVVQEIGPAGIQVLHVTGHGKQLMDARGELVTAQGYHQVEYVDGMEQVYAAADLLVARSGAATVSEVAAVGLPAIFVPLPIGNGEQALNARSLVNAGAAHVVKDAEFTPEYVRDTVFPLATDTQALAQMAQAARGAGVRDAAATMAQLILQEARA